MRYFILASIAALLLLSRTAVAVEPTAKDLRYGPYQENAFDLYMPANGPTPPIAIFLHGGGFKSGDKSQVVTAGQTLTELLDAGIAVVSANYRLVSSGSELTLDEIFKEDLTLLVQSLRYNAARLGLNPNKIGAYGNSAGAGAALWMGVHDDVADPQSSDPVKRESSKVQVVGHLAGQATYDTAAWANIAQVASNWAHVTGFEDDLLWYGVTARYQLLTPTVLDLVRSIDLPSLMSPDDAYLYIENYTAEEDLAVSSSMTDTEKNAAVIYISHAPLHAYFLERSCQVQQMYCEVYTLRNFSFIRGQMAAFFQTYLH